MKAPTRRKIPRVSRNTLLPDAELLGLDHVALTTHLWDPSPKSHSQGSAFGYFTIFITRTATLVATAILSIIITNRSKVILIFFHLLSTCAKQNVKHISYNVQFRHTREGKRKRFIEPFLMCRVLCRMLFCVRFHLFLVTASAGHWMTTIL